MKGPLLMSANRFSRLTAEQSSIAKSADEYLIFRFRAVREYASRCVRCKARPDMFFGPPFGANGPRNWIICDYLKVGRSRFSLCVPRRTQATTKVDASDRGQLSTNQHIQHDMNNNEGQQSAILSTRYVRSDQKALWDPYGPKLYHN
jgi:hypothetical protein